MTSADIAPVAVSLPLVVDLDGTLLATDMLHESAVGLLRASPLSVLRIPFWLARGKAALKAELARRFDFDPALLPLNEPFVAWLREQRQAGRQLVLATASDEGMAKAIAGHLGLFDAVLASDGTTNLGGGPRREPLSSASAEAVSPTRAMRPPTCPCGARPGPPWPSTRRHPLWSPWPRFALWSVSSRRIQPDS